jgi:hypothetical protein
VAHRARTPRHFIVVFPWIRPARSTKEKSSPASKRIEKGKERPAASPRRRRRHRTRASKEGKKGTQRELEKLCFFFPRKGTGLRRARTALRGRWREIVSYHPKTRSRRSPVRRQEVGRRGAPFAHRSFSLWFVCSAGFVQGWCRAEQGIGVTERYMFSTLSARVGFEIVA